MWAWLAERRGKAQYIASQQQTKIPNRGSPDFDPCKQQEKKKENCKKAKKSDERMKDLSQCKCGG